MASTHTTKARVVAAAMRWSAKVEAGRDASSEEEHLLDRCLQHKKADLAARRSWDRFRNPRGVCGDGHANGATIVWCVRRDGHDGRHKDDKGFRWGDA